MEYRAIVGSLSSAALSLAGAVSAAGVVATIDRRCIVRNAKPLKRDLRRRIASGAFEGVAMSAALLLSTFGARWQWDLRSLLAVVALVVGAFAVGPMIEMSTRSA